MERQGKSEEIFNRKGRKERRGEELWVVGFEEGNTAKR
jgi:hypothetical protein